MQCLGLVLYLSSIPTSQCLGLALPEQYPHIPVPGVGPIPEQYPHIPVPGVGPIPEQYPHIPVPGVGPIPEQYPHIPVPGVGLIVLGIHLVVISTE